MIYSTQNKLKKLFSFFSVDPDILIDQLNKWLLSNIAKILRTYVIHNVHFYKKIHKRVS